MQVDGAGALPALADGPDDKALAAPHVAAGEDLVRAGFVVERVGEDIAALVELDAEVPDHSLLHRAELVLLAMGFLGPVQEGLVQGAGVATDKRSNVMADTVKYQTSREKFFACGDMRRGQSLVVWAIREGRQCARSMDEWLMGKTDLPR